MYLKIKKKKYEVLQVDKFWERFKCMKFVLEPLDRIFLFNKKKSISTTFFCQKVDLVFTDNNNTILYIFPKVKTEKRITKFKSNKIYIFPVDTANNFNIGDTLKITEK